MTVLPGALSPGPAQEPYLEAAGGMAWYLPGVLRVARKSNTPIHTVHLKGGQIMANNPGRYPGDGDSGNLVTEQVRQGTQQVVQGTQHAVSQVKHQAAQQAQSMFERQKDQAKTQLDTIATALRQAGENLRQQEQGTVAGVLEGAAGEVDGWGQYLENRNMTEMIGDVENVARRHSAMFLAGAFTLGLIAARFLKSSSSGQSGQGGTSGGRQGYGAYGAGGQSAYGYGQAGAPPYGSSVDDTAAGGGYGAAQAGYGNAGYQTSVSGFTGTSGLSESVDRVTTGERGDVESDRPY